MSKDRIQLGHGAGGLMTGRLVEEIFLQALGRPAPALDDAARLVGTGQGELTLTTDAFVVDPLEFPGGDIGELAVCGTVNDLWVCGARPLGLSAAFILEEGLELDLLRRVVASMARAAREAGVQVITGDTKVVPRGKGDGVYITTAGVGRLLPGVKLGPDLAHPGDRLLISGTVGQHGAAVMARRAGLDPEQAVRSDCAPLGALLEPLLREPSGLRAMRDPTRGGLAAVLCELSAASGVTFEIQELAIPLGEPLRVTCELLGLDPLHLACEGRCLIVAAPDAADRALDLLRAHPQGKDAADIGQVSQGQPRVIMHTTVGGSRLITLPASDPLPRIC